MVKIKYLKGNYTDKEIIDVLNSIDEVKSLKSIKRFKAFGQMLQAKLKVKDIKRESIVRLIKNLP